MKPFTKDSTWENNKNTLKQLPHHKQIKLFACDVARLTLPIWEHYHPKDKRPRIAIETAELFLYRKVTEEQLRKAASAAANAADAAWVANAADVANITASAASAASSAADAASAGAWVANAAANAAWAASAAWAANTAENAANAEANLRKVIQNIFHQTTSMPIPITPVLQSIAINIVETRNFEEYYVLLDNLEEEHNIQLPREVPLGLSHYVLFSLTNTN